MPAATAMAAATMEALVASGVFARSVMAGITHVALAVSRLIGMEIVERMFSPVGHGPSVAMARIIAIIHVAIEPVVTVEPGTCANKDAAGEPVWPVIAIGRAIVGSVVEVAVRTDGRSADTD